MKKSLITKTTFVISGSLFVIALFYSVFVYQKQKESIYFLINHEKEFIEKSLHEREIKEIKKEKINILRSADLISIPLAYALFNLDEQEAKRIIKEFLNFQDIVKGVEVYDLLADSLFVAAYKEKKVVFVDNLPKKIKNLDFVTFDLVYNNKKIGEFRVFYTLKPIKNLIVAQKQEKLKELQKRQQILKEHAVKILIFMITLFFVVIFLIDILIYFLIKKFVSEPLKKLHKGLNSFFNFLKNPQEQVENISCKNDDEIGEMIYEISQSIQISANLHKDISDLLNVVDTNVLVISFGEDKRVEDVSSAFLKLSNYSREEVIGKKIDELFEIDQKTLEEMWRVLKNKKVFSKVFSLISKEGKRLYLKAIITPKCDNVCEYDAIFFDITDKRKVEELLETLEDKVEERTKELKNAKQEIENLLVRIKDSISYASFIQHAILSKEEIFKEAFKDYFIIYKPKDIVGGDIYQLIKLQDKYLLMVMDCTSHGVAGAFVTILVKAISEQIILALKEGNLKKSPSAILSYFNVTIKQILKQYKDSHTKSNVGFDGAVLCYSPLENTITFSGANIPLFYVKDDEVYTIKPDKMSVGYKTSEEDYQFKEEVIELKENMKFYITTDGFIDQNGGEKDMPFGKKRFMKLIKENHNLPFSKQKEVFLKAFQEWRNDEQTDDITLIGIRV